MAEPNTTCESCGKAYYIKSSRLNISRFCSRACKDSLGGLSQACLVELYYDQHYSMQEIAQTLGCSVNKVVYWMNHYGLERRDWSEASYVKRNPNGDPFTIYEPQTTAEWMLFGLGLGLYMGEGTKKSRASLTLANTNPKIIQVFIQFIETFCGIKRNQLRVTINMYDDCNPDIVNQWWCEQLQLDTTQFTQPIIRASRGGIYLEKSKYGTIAISYHNIKLKAIIDSWCDTFYDAYTQ